MTTLLDPSARDDGDPFADPIATLCRELSASGAMYCAGGSRERATAGIVDKNSA